MNGFWRHHRIVFSQQGQPSGESLELMLWCQTPLSNNIHLDDAMLSEKLVDLGYDSNGARPPAKIIQDHNEDAITTSTLKIQVKRPQGSHDKQWQYSNQICQKLRKQKRCF